MYKGGTIVCADDDKLDYSSYFSEGLCCLVCNEDVHLRAGYEKQRHFAHNKALDSSPICFLRVTNHSQTWSDFTSQGRGQRRKLFQKYFLHMIKSNKPDFELNIQFVKDRLSYQILKNFIDKCCQCFYEKADDLIADCHASPDISYNANSVLQKLIAGEAISYLCVSSSRNLLEQLVYYSIYFCHNFSYSSWDAWINNSKPIDICHQIKDTLISTSWLSVFDKDTSDEDNLNPTSEDNNDKIIPVIKKYIYPRGKSSEPFKIYDLAFKLQLKDSLVYLLDTNASRYRIITTIAQIKDSHKKEGDEKIIIDLELLNNKQIMQKSTIMQTLKPSLTPRQYQIKLIEYTLDFYQQLQGKIGNYLKSQIKPNNVSIEFYFLKGLLFDLEQKLERQKDIEKKHIEEQQRERERKKKIQKQRLEVRQRELERKKKIQKQCLEAQQRELERKKQFDEKFDKILKGCSGFPPYHKIKCPYCNFEVKKRNFKKHIFKVHSYK
jgi:hypothetical protein